MPQLLRNLIARAIKEREGLEGGYLTLAHDPAGSPPHSPERGRGCFLLAEDNPINREVAVGMLEELGYRVEVADNGREAAEAAKNSSQTT